MFTSVHFILLSPQQNLLSPHRRSISLTADAAEIKQHRHLPLPPGLIPDLPPNSSQTAPWHRGEGRFSMNPPLPQYHFLLLLLLLLCHRPPLLLGPRRQLPIAGSRTETGEFQVSPVKPPLLPEEFIRTTQVIPSEQHVFAVWLTLLVPLFSSRHLSLQVKLAERRGRDGTCLTVKWLIFLASGRCVPSVTSASPGASLSPSLSCPCTIRPAAELSVSETSCCSGDRYISEQSRTD